MLIDEIYQQLHSTRLAPNHAIFSVRFLGRSARYYDYLRCTGSQASLTALTTLAVRLIALADRFREDGRWSHYSKALDDTADRVWVEIEARTYRDAWGASRVVQAPAALIQGMEG